MHPMGNPADRLEIVVVNYGGLHRELAAGLGAVRVEEVEMNLEDAFIAYTRGETRPLPSFDREPIQC